MSAQQVPIPKETSHTKAAAANASGRKGVGKPYAPMDFPNKGDVWTWKTIGNKVSSLGFYEKRSVGLPVSLRKKPGPKSFASKPMLSKYIEDNYNGQAAAEVLKSFTWKIPVADEAVPIPQSHAIVVSSLERPDDDPIVMERYMQSLLTSHHPEALSLLDSGSFSDWEWEEDLEKIYSLLEKGVSALFDSKDDVAVLSELATKVKKNSSLSAHQKAMMKLIEELPKSADVFQQNKHVKKDADRSLAALELERGAMSSLHDDYNKLNLDLKALQDELKKNSVEISSIDYEITRLQKRRIELSKEKEISDLIENRKRVFDSFCEKGVELNSKISEWKRKKSASEEVEAEIILKFTPLAQF